MKAPLRKYTGLKFFREKILENERIYNIVTPFSWESEHQDWSVSKTNKVNLDQIQHRLKYANISLKYHIAGGATDSIIASVGGLLVFIFYKYNPTVSFCTSIPTLFYTINALKEWYTVFNQLEIKHRLQRIETSIQKKNKS